MCFIEFHIVLFHTTPLLLDSVIFSLLAALFAKNHASQQWLPPRNNQINKKHFVFKLAYLVLKRAAEDTLM